MKQTTLCLAILFTAADVRGEEPAPVTPPTPSVPFVVEPTPTLGFQPPDVLAPADHEQRGFLESDHAFDNFIGPISNPVLSKDPRSLTEARLLFVADWIPNDNGLGGGDFQAYGLQLRLALTDRLTFIADKDGFASIHAHALPSETGWLDIAFGLKYALVRDVEDQFLVTAGFMFEPQTGESKVFQGQGTGLWTLFLSSGKEFAEFYHVIGNAGYEFPSDPNQNSSFFYAQLHFDRQVAGWLYPLLELNWYHYTQSGDRGLAASIGEGDGLLNLGTSGVAGTDLVTLAAGLKAHLGPHADAGIAYEFPISNREDLISSRLLVELIFRY